MLHFITPEYPPQPGGVADYTFLVGQRLAESGAGVHIWCPNPSNLPEEQTHGAVSVHRTLGSFSPSDLRNTGALLDRFPAPRRLVVQWVPHGYGFYSMNVAFCAWLWYRAKRRRDRVELMVHEPCLAFREGSWKQDLAAGVHRVMLMLLLDSAEKVWMSIPDWERTLRPWARKRELKYEWLPVPSNVPVVDDAAGIALLRDMYGQGRLILGHFGTYGSPVSHLLAGALPPILSESPEVAVLLMGRGSKEFRSFLVSGRPELAERIYATGGLEPADLSRHLSACDLILQPYPDGISTRRTSAMASLAHGRPTVSTIGRLSEDFWVGSKAVAVAPAGDSAQLAEAVRRLLHDPEERRALGLRAKRLYDSRFAVEKTVAALLEGSGAPVCAY